MALDQASRQDPEFPSIFAALRQEYCGAALPESVAFQKMSLGTLRTELLKRSDALQYTVMRDGSHVRAAPPLAAPSAEPEVFSELYYLFYALPDATCVLGTRCAVARSPEEQLARLNKSQSSAAEAINIPEGDIKFCLDIKGVHLWETRRLTETTPTLRCELRAVDPVTSEEKLFVMTAPTDSVWIGFSVLSSEEQRVETAASYRELLDRVEQLVYTTWRESQSRIAGLSQELAKKTTALLALESKDQYENRKQIAELEEKLAKLKPLVPQLKELRDSWVQEIQGKLSTTFKTTYRDLFGAYEQMVGKTKAD